MTSRFYEIQIEIESNCYLKCLHCSSSSSANTTTLLTKADILRFLHIFNGASHVYFTGGEPLLYPDLFSLCSQIQKEMPHISMGLYTTGNLSNNMFISHNIAKKMKASGICDCYFSIYSTHSSFHDRWTQTSGSMRHTVDSIKSIKEVGISPKVHLVLTRDNILSISEVISFCERLGVEEVRILKLIKAGRASYNWDTIGLSEGEQNIAIEKVLRNKNDYKVKINVSGFPHLSPCRSFQDSAFCQAGINLLYIDHSGDVFPCACAKRFANSARICNIKELGLMEKYIDAFNEIPFREKCLNEH